MSLARLSEHYPTDLLKSIASACPVDFVQYMHDELERLRRELSLAHQRADELERMNTELCKQVEFLSFRCNMTVIEEEL